MSSCVGVSGEGEARFAREAAEMKAFVEMDIAGDIESIIDFKNKSQASKKARKQRKEKKEAKEATNNYMAAVATFHLLSSGSTSSTSSSNNGGGPLLAGTGDNIVSLVDKYSIKSIGFGFGFTLPQIEGAINGLKGFGMEVGITKDANGMAFYITGKFATETSLIFNAGINISQAVPTNNDFNSFNIGFLSNQGHSFEIDASFIGYSLSNGGNWKLNEPSLYIQHSISYGFGFGVANWQTDTWNSGYFWRFND